VLDDRIQVRLDLPPGLVSAGLATTVGDCLEELHRPTPKNGRKPKAAKAGSGGTGEF